MYTLGQGDYQIKVKPRLSLKAKRVSIKVNNRFEVELIVPSRMPLKKALKFLNDNETWIRNKLVISHKYNNTEFIDGNIIPILGTNYKITHSGNLRGVTIIEDSKLVVNGPIEFTSRKVETFLREQISQLATKLAINSSELLGLKYNKITIRDTNTRWGSCSSNGNISLCWRLVFAPLPVVNYVICHEIVHLAHMNHSKQFWQKVEKICPDYKKHRKWLKNNSSILHSYGKR